MPDRPTARVVYVDDNTRARVVDALRTTATRYARAATRAAGELEAAKADGTVADERAGAVRIARSLAEASSLEAFADALETAEAADVPRGTHAAQGIDDPHPTDVDDADPYAEELDGPHLPADRAEAHAALEADPQEA